MFTIQQPNQFTLTGTKSQITYSTSSFAGQPQLQYTDQQQTRSFNGDEIDIQDTRLGNLITVTIEVVPDLHTITLTLLLPSINLTPQATESNFTTYAILTRHPTSIGGTRLVEGPLQLYTIEELQGTASQVDFLK